jgi:cytochrome c553
MEYFRLFASGNAGMSEIVLKMKGKPFDANRLIYNGPTMLPEVTSALCGIASEITKYKRYIPAFIVISGVSLLGVSLLIAAPAPPPSDSKAATVAAKTTATFDKDVQPVLVNVCNTCHNPQLNSGNLNITPYFQASSLTANRDGWAKILAKLKAGEMPPPGIPGPSPEAMATLIGVVQAGLDKADQNQKPDPGRTIAHRLNRVEYANTIRDLLGVDFRTSEEFPADDSGYGFDNIGDVLTVSPVLTQKYLSAAEQIASRAVGGDPLPKAGYVNRHDRVRKAGDSAIELRDAVDYDAEYAIKVNITGHRGATDKPVHLRISVDGKTVKEVDIPVQISAVNRQGGATQRNSEEGRIFLTANEHTFRAEFVNDDFVKPLSAQARTNANTNIFPEAIEIGGPYPPSTPQATAKKVLICDPATGTACVNRILTEFAHHAYRRPVTKPEVAELTAIYDKAAKAGYSPKQSLQFAIADALVKPQFLFRIEHDPAPGVTARISDLELASRLSFFIWSSTPDDELLKLAEANKLHTNEVLDAQVNRLIADPRSSALADNFAGQWLQTRSLDAMKPDAKKFPEWSPELKEAMRTETRMFFQAVMQENRPIADFIDGKYTFLNEQLAKFYGMDGIAGQDFRRVELTDAQASQRSGVFTQASVLTVSSYPTRTSVVLRGKYLLETVLNSPPPPPPPDVPRLNEDTVGVAKSLRQQMEAHRADALCASCHSKMDVLGFGLENYDAIGRWRTTDGKFPIDSSGNFPNGKTFNGPAEMKALLHDNMPEFIRCLAEKMLTYGLGRGVESYDRPVVDDLVKQTAAGDNRLQPLIIGIVHSLPFQQRRGEAKQMVASSNVASGK